MKARNEFGSARRRKDNCPEALIEGPVYFAEQVVWTAEIDFKGKSITPFPKAEATFGHLLAFAGLTSTLSYTFKLFTTRKAWSG